MLDLDSGEVLLVRGHIEVSKTVTLIFDVCVCVKQLLLPAIKIIQHTFVIEMILYALKCSSITS